MLGQQRQEIFVPERVLTREEVDAYARYVDWRAERAGKLVEKREEARRRFEAQVAALKESRRTEAIKREQELEQAVKRAAARRQACEAEKAARAEKLRRRMHELGFIHPHAKRQKRFR